MKRSVVSRECFKFGPANRSWILLPPTETDHGSKIYVPSAQAALRQMKLAPISFSATTQDEWMR